MLRTIDKIRNLRERAENNHESGAAMIFAIILLMLMLFVSLLIATTATVQAGVARDQRLRESYNFAANNGVEWMLMQANQNPAALETYRGVGNAYTYTPYSGEYDLDNIRWRVYTEQVATSGGGLSYYVYSTGYDTVLGVNKGSTLRATFESYPISTAAYNVSGTPTYYLKAENTWGNGILGLSSIQINAGSKLYSYESGIQGNTPTGTSNQASVATTNTAVTLGDASTAVKSVITSIPSSANGCKPTSNCAAVSTSFRGAELRLNTVTDLVNTKCPNASYPVWVASNNGGLLNLGATQRCWGGLVFDVPTTLSGMYTDTNPLALYVKGGVTVNSNVNINGSPIELQIFSRAGNLNINNVKANLLYASNDASCTVTGNSAVFFGATSCASISVAGNAKYYYDISSKSAAPDTSRRVWLKVFIEQL